MKMLMCEEAQNSETQKQLPHIPKSTEVTSQPDGPGDLQLIPR